MNKKLFSGVSLQICIVIANTLHISMLDIVD
jgi:hypothetical protein